MQTGDQFVKLPRVSCVGFLEKIQLKIKNELNVSQCVTKQLVQELHQLNPNRAVLPELVVKYLEERDALNGESDESD